MEWEQKREGPEMHYDMGSAWGTQAPVMVLHFDGAIDAGAVGSVAVQQMTRSLRVERVSTFDSDAFIDFRSHRPVMVVEDWVSADLHIPEIVVDRVDDDLGKPFLLVHGPEPDMRWETFAEELHQIALAAGVEMTVSLHGIPAGAPHTRPPQVHVQATHRDLVPPQPQMMQPIHFPSPVSSFVQKVLSEQGIEGVALLGSVPFYMTDRMYPAVSSALLSKLMEFTGLTLPVGELEQLAAEEAASLNEFMAEHSELSQTVEALEQNYDNLTIADGKVPLTAMSAGAAENLQHRDQIKASHIGDVIEAYLANVTRHEEDAKAEQQNDITPAAVPTRFRHPDDRRVQVDQSSSTEQYPRPNGNEEDVSDARGAHTQQPDEAEKATTHNAQGDPLAVQVDTEESGIGEASTKVSQPPVMSRGVEEALRRVRARREGKFDDPSLTAGRGLHRADEVSGSEEHK